MLYFQIGSGTPGGEHFVKEWLWPFLNNSEVNFGGAIILDSIMNLNLASASQQLGQDFKEVRSVQEVLLPESIARSIVVGENRRARIHSVV